MYTLEQIRKAGTEGEICSIDVDHLITVLIELYGSGISQNDGKPIVSRRCICCGFEIKPIHGGGEDKPWQGMWLDGIVDKIAANYGSELDGYMYVVALCDGCVRAKLKAGLIEYVGNYMQPSDNGG